MNRITIHIPIKFFDKRHLEWLCSNDFKGCPVILWIKDFQNQFVFQDLISFSRDHNFLVKIYKESFKSTLVRIYKYNCDFSLIIGVGDIINFDGLEKIELKKGVTIFNYGVYNYEKGSYYERKVSNLFEKSKLELFDVFSFIGNVIFDNATGNYISDELLNISGPRFHEHSHAILRLVLNGKIEYNLIESCVVWASTLFEDSFRTSATSRLLIDYEYICFIKCNYSLLKHRVSFSVLRELKCILYDLIYDRVSFFSLKMPENFVCKKSILFWVFRFKYFFKTR